LFHDVPKAHIIDFVSEYHLDDAQHSMPKDLMLRYIRGRSDETAQLWNVALMGSSKQSHRLPDGSDTYTVEQYPFAEGISVTMNVRSRLFNWKGSANIKALMSAQDVVVDLDPSIEKVAKRKERIEQREEHLDGRGLLLLYPIAGNSPPLKKQPVDKDPIREALGADIDVMGYGIVFPKGAPSGAQVDIQWGTVGLPREVFENGPVDDSEEYDPDELELLENDDDSPSSNVDLSGLSSDS
jgi:hypothetical protein